MRDPTDIIRHPLQEENVLFSISNLRPELPNVPDIQDVQDVQEIWELLYNLTENNANTTLEKYCIIRSLKSIKFENLQITREILMRDDKIKSDIELVISQTNASNKHAYQALLKCQGDVVDAIMSLVI